MRKSLSCWPGSSGQAAAAPPILSSGSPPVRAEAGETLAKPPGRVSPFSPSASSTESRRPEDSAPSGQETERWFWGSALRRTS